MLTLAQRDAVQARISTAMIGAVASELESCDRALWSLGLDQACERLAVHLQEAGATRVELGSFRGGAEQRHLGLAFQPRPVPELAELFLLGPPGNERLLCRRADDPSCFIGAYRSTAEGGEVLEVVDVGPGTRASDFRGRRVHGRVVLVSGHHLTAALYESLVCREAAGMLVGPGATGREGERWGPSWRLPELASLGRGRPFCFVLPAGGYEQLAARLAAGEQVRVRVKLRMALGSGALPVLTASLGGAELAEERVVLLASIEEEETPLAAAALVEVLRVLGAGVVAGELPTLRRSLEVVVLPGPAGTVAWLGGQQGFSGAGEGGPIKAAVALTLPRELGPWLVELQGTLPSSPTFLSDLLAAHLREAGTGTAGLLAKGVPFEVRPVGQREWLAGPGLRSPVAPFVGGAAAGSSALPAVWLRCLALAPHCPAPARMAGGSLAGPRPGGLSLDGMREVVSGLATAALDLCTAQDHDLPRFLGGSLLGGHRRLLARAEALRERLQDELGASREAGGTGLSGAGRASLWLIGRSLTEAARREREVLRGAAGFLRAPGGEALGLADAAARLEAVREALEGALSEEVRALAGGPRVRLEPRRRRLTALERRAAAVVVWRTAHGPLLDEGLGREARPADRAWLAHQASALAAQPRAEEIGQWIDNRRTVFDLAEQLRLDHAQLDLRLLWRFLEVMEGAGLLELHEDLNLAVPGSH